MILSLDGVQVRGSKTRYIKAVRRLRTAYAVVRGRTRQPDDLTLLADLYGSDKGSQHFNKHLYTRIYYSLFARRRFERLRFLEIGLLHASDPGWLQTRRENYGTASATRAPSLRMWSEFLPNAMIVGFDINDFSAVRIERCSVYRGDMSSRDDLQHLVDQSGGQFDIIIDDASHASHHQQIALGFLFSNLAPGGLYIIEDLHWQPPELELQGATKTQEILRQLQVTGRFGASFMTDEEQRELFDQVASVHLFDSLNPGESPINNADALAVLFKKS